jgi:flagellar basal-body rod protein FlgC
MFSAMEVAASGLSAQRVRMNTIASNLANAQTTRTEAGGAYRRVDPLFQTKSLTSSSVLGGAVSQVQVTDLVRDERPGRLVHEPDHPDANFDGYVEYPNVNVVEEMVNMITASRAYEAGVTAIDSVKSMARSAMGIGR